ncbi:hypothetical protein Ddc_03265 [Ditylenchus destructor]|nr:hypothetical protein Ddc_03265 [Ditylenchus destructor]
MKGFLRVVKRFQPGNMGTQPNTLSSRKRIKEHFRTHLLNPAALFQSTLPFLPSLAKTAERQSADPVPAGRERGRCRLVPVPNC